MKKNVIEVKNLEKYFEVSGGFFSRKKATVKAVDDITFEIPFGESLGLVGQSGCGKTTTARALCLLDPKTGGEVSFYNNEKTYYTSVGPSTVTGNVTFYLPNQVGVANSLLYTT